MKQYDRRKNTVKPFFLPHKKSDSELKINMERYFCKHAYIPLKILNTYLKNFGNYRMVSFITSYAIVYVHISIELIVKQYVHRSIHIYIILVLSFKLIIILLNYVHSMISFNLNAFCQIR